MTGPPPLLAAARDRLARAQADLLAALLAGAPPPPGFDPTRIRIQTDALLAKRRAVVARLRPDLVDLAGTAFRGRFDAYARAHPRPACARDDADAFARTLSTADDAVRPAPGDRIHRHTRISTAARRVADRLGTLRLFVADDVGGGLGAAVPALKARAWRRHRSSQ